MCRIRATTAALAENGEASHKRTCGVMVALRRRPLAALSGPFWLSAFSAAFAPTTLGYQDLAVLLARQAGVPERAREHLIASPFGTIHAATFRFSRPIGTAMPEPMGPQQANFDPRALDVKYWFGDQATALQPALHVEYPTINRRLKGDRMPLPQSAPAQNEPQSLPPLQPVTTPPPLNPHAPVTLPRAKSAEEIKAAPSSAPSDAAIDAFGSVPGAKPGQGEAADALTPSAVMPADVEDDVPLADKPPEIPVASESDTPDGPASSFAALSFVDEDPAARETQLFVGIGRAAGSRSGLEQWAPGAEPILVSPPPAGAQIKLSALEQGDAASAGSGTLADKDDVSRLKSPAERLGLSGKQRARAEKCLADAVYFEARGEPLKGQQAVAQVVMNRVFSGFYPDNVCGVVYQNADRHLACQFTFACEGKDLSRIDEPDMWEQAKRIAKDELDGKIWLADVGHATHYHAYWVHPSWVHEMKKMYSLGVHTFYRPRAWLDGAADAPAWTLPPAFNPDGTPAQPPDAAKEPAGAKGPEAATKGPQAAISPEPAAGKTRG